MAHGLWRLNHGQLKHWSMREGLPSNRITAIMEDLAGNLWFSSDNGFFSSSPEQFGAQQHEQNAPLLFRRISSADGLEAKMGSGAGNPVVSRSPDGRLWFPNQFAVAVFDPAKIKKNTTYAKPHQLSEGIEALIVNGTLTIENGKLTGKRNGQFLA